MQRRQPRDEWKRRIGLTIDAKGKRRDKVSHMAEGFVSIAASRESVGGAATISVAGGIRKFTHLPRIKEL